MDGSAGTEFLLSRLRASVRTSHSIILALPPPAVPGRAEAEWGEECPVQPGSTQFSLLLPVLHTVIVLPLLCCLVWPRVAGPPARLYLQFNFNFWPRGSHA